jgi:hypothetical protein
LDWFLQNYQGNIFWIEHRKFEKQFHSNSSYLKEKLEGAVLAPLV